MRRLNFQRFPVLQTERLVLRKLVAEDDVDIFSIRSNEKINLHLDRPLMKSMEEAEELIVKLNKGVDDNKWIFWAVTLKPEAKLIGTICLWNISRREETAEIGFELNTRMQGRGLMLEAAQKVMTYGLTELELKKIEGWTKSDNERAIRLMERCGFKRDEVAEKEKLEGAEVGETVIYSLVRRE